MPPARAVEIAARIIDASRVAFPRLYYRRCGDSRYQSLPLTQVHGTYTGSIPGAAVTVDGIEYYLEAFDVHGNGPALHGTPEQPHRIWVAPLDRAASTSSGEPGGVQPPPAGVRAGGSGPPGETDWHRLRLAASGLVGWSPGGLTPSLQALLEVGLLPRPWLSIELVVGVPVVPPQVSSAEGEARLDPLLLAVQARLLFRRQDRIGLSVGAGAGALLVRMSGTAQAGYLSAVDWVASSLLYGLGGLSIRLSPRWRIGVEAVLGLALPRPVASFGEHEVGSFGRPLLGGALGVEVALF